MHASKLYCRLNRSLGFALLSLLPELLDPSESDQRPFSQLEPDVPIEFYNQGLTLIVVGS